MADIYGKGKQREMDEESILRMNTSRAMNTAREMSIGAAGHGDANCGPVAIAEESITEDSIQPAVDIYVDTSPICRDRMHK